MDYLTQCIIHPLAKIAGLLFNLEISVYSGHTTLGSIIIVGFVFIVLIGAIMHGGSFISNIFELRHKRKQDAYKD